LPTPRTFAHRLRRRFRAQHLRRVLSNLSDTLKRWCPSHGQLKQNQLSVARRSLLLRPRLRHRVALPFRLCMPRCQRRRECPWWRRLWLRQLRREPQRLALLPRRLRRRPLRLCVPPALLKSGHRMPRQERQSALPPRRRRRLRVSVLKVLQRHRRRPGSVLASGRNRRPGGCLPTRMCEKCSPRSMTRAKRDRRE
jgi:hypothetical protein